MTSNFSDSVIALLLALEKAETVNDILRLVRTVAAPFGYDRFALYSASTRRGEFIDRIFWVDGEWFDGVDVETYIRRCPVTRHVVETSVPFFWSKIESDLAPRYRIVERPGGPGVHGFQVPVYGPLGLEGAMSFGGRRIDAARSTQILLTLLTEYAFKAARALTDSPTDGRPARLSGREREVLAWISSGRRQAEIAETLGISARTVENHLRHIRARLGVATTAQAIRLAIRTGQLQERSELR